QVHAERAEDLDGHAVTLPDQPEEQVAGAEVPARPACLPQRELEALLGPWRERDVPARRRLTMADEGLDPLAHGVQGDAGRHEELRGRAAVLPEQARQHVLGTDVVVVQLPGLFLGEGNSSMGLVSEPLDNDITPT